MIFDLCVNLMRRYYVAGSPLHHTTSYYITTQKSRISYKHLICTHGVEPLEPCCHVSIFSSLQDHVHVQVHRAHDPSHSTHQPLHQRAAHHVKLADVRKAAWKPPPPPQPFLVHFGCCRANTAGDDDAPADCCTCEPTPQLVHWR